MWGPPRTGPQGDFSPRLAEPPTLCQLQLWGSSLPTPPPKWFPQRFLSKGFCSGKLGFFVSSCLFLQCHFSGESKRSCGFFSLFSFFCCCWEDLAPSKLLSYQIGNPTSLCLLVFAWFGYPRRAVTSHSELRSAPSSSAFWKGWHKIDVTSLNVGRILQWNHLRLKMSFFRSFLNYKLNFLNGYMATQMSISTLVEFS